MYVIVTKDNKTGGVVTHSPAKKWLKANGHDYSKLAKKQGLTEYKLVHITKLKDYMSYETLDTSPDVLRSSLWRDLNKMVGITGTDRPDLREALKAAETIEDLKTIELEIENDN